MDAKLPNIVLITAHDLGRHLGCYGVKTVQSPNIDSLASDGVRFANAFAAVSECDPSWATLSTGRYSHCNGVMGRSRLHFSWELHPGERALARVLQTAGYRTAAIGVNGIFAGAVTRTQSFIEPSSRDQGQTTNDGFDEIIHAGRGEEVAGEAIEWLDRNGEVGTAFYLQLEFIEAHRQASHDPGARDYVGFLGDYITPDRSSGVTVPACVRDTPRAREELAELQGAIRYLDEQIGKLLDAFRRKRLEHDTLVVFTTDHGLAVPRAKGSLLDSGLETALIVRCPDNGWNGGEVISDLISTVDIFPTLIESAGLSVGGSVQGLSFKALLDGETYRSRDHLFAEMNYHDYYDPMRCVRTLSHKLIINFSNGRGFTDPAESWRPAMTEERRAGGAGEAFHPLYELYDLSSDPGEWRNVADDPAYGAVRGRLLELLRDWMHRTGDPLFSGAVTSPFHRWAVSELEAAGGSGPFREKTATGKTAVSRKGGKRRPNVILMHCHDLGQFLCCYGIPTVQSPNLDALAASGIRFTRLFSTAPQCSPSRAGMVTGRYPHSNGVMGLSQANFAWDLHPEERHVAGLFRDAGYGTSMIGLHHEGRCGKVLESAFSGQQPFATEEEIGKRCGFDYIKIFGKGEEVAGRAIETLRRASQTDQPFFMEVGFSEPHRRRSAKAPYPEYEGFIGDYMEPDDRLGVTVPAYILDDAMARHDFAELQGAIRYMDTQAGKIISALRNLNMEDDTLVVFTTDHGIAMPRAKSTLYDPGIRVALIVRFPSRGWSGGRVYEELVSNIDIVPTLLDAAGIDVPSSVQGRSLAPLLDGREYLPREEIFAEMSYQNYYDPRRCIRTDRHKLIVYFTESVSLIQQTGAWYHQITPAVPNKISNVFHPLAELFDLEKDPNEFCNLIDEPAYREIRQGLLSRLYRWMRDTGDPLLEGAVAAPMHRWALELVTGKPAK